MTAFALAPIFIFESVLLVTGILRNYIRSMGPDLASVVKEALAWLRSKAGMVSDPSKDYPSEFESLAINYTLESAPSHIFNPEELRRFVWIPEIDDAGSRLGNLGDLIACSWLCLGEGKVHRNCGSLPIGWDSGRRVHLHD